MHFAKLRVSSAKHVRRLFLSPRRLEINIQRCEPACILLLTFDSVFAEARLVLVQKLDVVALGLFDVALTSIDSNQHLQLNEIKLKDKK